MIRWINSDHFFKFPRVESLVELASEFVSCDLYSSSKGKLKIGENFNFDDTSRLLPYWVAAVALNFIVC